MSFFKRVIGGSLTSGSLGSDSLPGQATEYCRILSSLKNGLLVLISGQLATLPLSVDAIGTIQGCDSIPQLEIELLFLVASVLLPVVFMHFHMSLHLNLAISLRGGHAGLSSLQLRKLSSGSALRLSPHSW